MECGFFACPSGWEFLLPEGMYHLRSPWSMLQWQWDFLALTPTGCRMLGAQGVQSKLLLLPGDERHSRIHAGSVVTYGLSLRDTLTYSSLRAPVLCLQRQLTTIHGHTVEPQEFPLPALQHAEDLLPFLGARLIMTGSPYPGPG